jgi:putative Ca2+/H+ antiporter (TMEM165/GDT1 family)
MLDSLLVPTAIVALAEIGDKTQLLALILAARFRKPWPIIAGIIAATLANHAAAGAVGAWVAASSRIGAALDPGRELHRHCAVDPGAGQDG